MNFIKHKITRKEGRKISPSQRNPFSEERVGLNMQKTMPVLVLVCNREAPEEQECTANNAKSVQNMLERCKVHVK